jgi:hypothetical protein
VKNFETGDFGASTLYTNLAMEFLASVSSNCDKLIATGS